MFLPFSGRCDYCGRDDQPVFQAPPMYQPTRGAMQQARESGLNDAIAALKKVGDFRGVAVVKKLLAPEGGAL